MYVIEYTCKEPSWDEVRNIIQEQEPGMVIGKGPGNVVTVSYSPEQEAAMDREWRRRRKQKMAQATELAEAVGM